MTTARFTLLDYHKKDLYFKDEWVSVLDLRYLETRSNSKTRKRAIVWINFVKAGLDPCKNQVLMKI